MKSARAKIIRSSHEHGSMSGLASRRTTAYQFTDVQKKQIMYDVFQFIASAGTTMSSAHAIGFGSITVSFVNDGGVCTSLLPATTKQIATALGFLVDACFIERHARTNAREETFSIMPKAVNWYAVVLRLASTLIAHRPVFVRVIWWSSGFLSVLLIFKVFSIYA